MATIEIRDVTIKHARNVERLLLGEHESTMTDAELLENFARIGMEKMVTDYERRHARADKK